MMNTLGITDVHDLDPATLRGLYLNTRLELATCLHEKAMLEDFLFLDAQVRPCHVFGWSNPSDYPAFCQAQCDEKGENFSCKYQDSRQCLSRYAEHKALSQFLRVDDQVIRVENDALDR